VDSVAVDELHSVLIAAAQKLNPLFNMDDFTQTVLAATGSENRSKQGLSAYKLETFNVHNNDVYRKLVQDIPTMPEYPAKPPPRSTTQTKVSWRTNCANFTAAALLQKDMLPTFLYHKCRSGVHLLHARQNSCSPGPGCK
jgi:hypothetical protein